MSAPALTHAETGRLFPVCCAADISAEVKDRFLRLAQDRSGNEHFLVFVDSLEVKYTEPSEHGYSTPGAASSPFKGQTTDACAMLLQQLRRNGSDIDFEIFAIMDDRSLEDDTVLLVEAPALEDGSEEFKGEVRAAFEMADVQLRLYSIGDCDVLEDQEKAQDSADGVLRD